MRLLSILIIILHIQTMEIYLISIILMVQLHVALVFFLIRMVFVMVLLDMVMIHSMMEFTELLI